MDLLPLNAIKKEPDALESEDVKKIEDIKWNLDEHFNVQIKIESRSSIVFEDDELDLWEKHEDGEDLVENDDLKTQIKRECSKCNKILENNLALLQHNLKHLKIILPSCLEEYKYKCKICSAYYKHTEYLNTHYYDKHQIDTTKNIIYRYHECKMCKKFLPYKTWHSHVSDVHGKRNISCRICHKSFKCQRYYRNHMDRHNGKLAPNIAVHTSVKCDQCPAILRHKSALTTHKKNCHSNEICICDKCNARFKSQAYLVTHMKRVHYNDGKTYSCECGKRFKSPRNLRIHRKNSLH